MRWLVLLTDRLGEARADAEQTIIEGRASDFAEYRRLAGIIYGLKMAEELAKQVADEQMKE